MAGLEDIKTKVINNGCCYGCGVCVVSCPKDVMGMTLSDEGFYVPVILNEDKCVNCGLCRKVCAYLNNGLSRPSLNVKGFVAYSKDEKVQRNCSSGGVGFEIAKLLVEKEYKACGVKYSSVNERAEHFVSNDVGGFEESRGSKYLQSYSVETFKRLKGKEKWVVFGTPCQIDSLVRWVKQRKVENNFVFVDFFCHGVPSYHLWNNYLGFNKKKYGSEVIENVKFRDKRNGHGCHSWTMSFLSGGKEVVSSKRKDKDLFYRLFLSNECLNKACYEDCKYKNQNSSADIRIGDLWSRKYQESENALSAVFANTDQGRQIIEQLHDRCVIEEEDLEIVSDGQMTYVLKRSGIRARVIRDLSKGRSLKAIGFYIMVIHKLKQQLGKVVKGK
jgi:coenzyme F420-reducing hydrogenase beta subunit